VSRANTVVPAPVVAARVDAARVDAAPRGRPGASRQCEFGGSSAVLSIKSASLASGTPELGWEAWLGSLVGKGGWDLGVGQWLHVAAESAA